MLGNSQLPVTPVTGDLESSHIHASRTPMHIKFLESLNIYVYTLVSPKEHYSGRVWQQVLKMQDVGPLASL